MRNQGQQEQQDIISLGKIQPQAKELEEAVIGALLVESNSYYRIEKILSEEDFYDPVHQTIFRAIVNLQNKRRPIDQLTVLEELKQSGDIENIGGVMTLVNISDKISSSSHIEYHAAIIYQKSIARKIIKESSSLISKAYDETNDIEQLFEEFEKSLSNIQPNNSIFRAINMGEAITIALKEASSIQDDVSKGISHNIPTPLLNLTNSLNGGFRKPDLIIIGARPSMGKTQIALQIAKSASEYNHHVGFFSIEMTTVQLINRFLLEDGRIKTENLLSGKMSTEEWEAADQQAANLYNLPIHFVDHYSIRFINNIKSESRRLKRSGKLDILIIDYLGLIQTKMKFERRQRELGYITGELKSLAKELDIPIIALSQLSRPDKGSAVKVPRLDDLRESGDIEQDADIVLFIHKPDYYNPELTDWKNKGMIVISKYRNGSRNNVVIFSHDDRYKKIFDFNGKISTDLVF